MDAKEHLPQHPGGGDPDLRTDVSKWWYFLAIPAVITGLVLLDFALDWLLGPPESVLFLFAILSLGIIVGVFIRSQAAALALSFLLIFFPGFFLTGIFFPISSLPEIMRLEALALPGTHYAIITRSLFLQGAGLGTLWPYAAMLIGIGLAFTGVAALFFRKRLA